MHIPTCHTCNAPCELTVYRFVPLNNPALFLAGVEILLQAISEAAFPFVLTKVGPFVFVIFLSLPSCIGRMISSLLDRVPFSRVVFSVLEIASVTGYACAEFLRGVAFAVV